MSTTEILKSFSKELLEKGKGIRLQVFGWSMVPAIRSGDFIWIERLTSVLPKVGEILYFQDAAGRLVIHRLVAIKSEGDSVTLIVRGDGYGDRVDGIAPSAVLGRVTHVERKGVKKEIDLIKPTWLQKICRLLPLRILAKHL
ncbi:MAG: hypothetical protein A2W61_00765 [Deltaproteobacteria bacterium RIFCSPLOWO2_01_44_7]|nr:MAG: hypothetical protein A2712_05800 [Deltaproteobacteria bacterium RIFCSPHIGHO2_01_FULL_43_49]OGQ16644.1 MAG: hypothetical protein A3D22_06925 [Deltaproteobacteria bacterium RIFCSPHIGHO2_02_FULL_44_53]OGQ29782.1 MAG: hypothetical protein A3D98_09590 [Deltaproteobacteria bacterium RIFCSPHIGHO2_12_FULL_44_21]OGQ33072.1 MAG: hypothetical protein A2979_03570 [Deltaproteobacteria bacterium RIFCSPLOWO2_01_FULL_45_74]OGQ37939.1 MAG: hypothetical protein A2W61_00765 [Deltaproteobacteria bacterium 